MTSTATPTLAQQFAGVLAALETVSTTVADYRSVDENALLRLNRIAAHAQRLVTTHAAMVAGEIARRSAPALGSQGLAQRSGFRTVEQFVKATTGVPGRDAVAVLKAGRILGSADGEVDAVTGEISSPVEPWLRPVAVGLASGGVSVAAADAIRTGLGVPNSAVTPAQLEVAARELCAAAGAGVDVDRLFRLARDARDDLDTDGVAVREAERRQQRALRLALLPSGMGRLTWDLDRETFVTVKGVYDRAVSPKLGGIRFVDPARKAKSDAILVDERTPAQLASDAFEQLVKAGAAADTSRLLGTGAPVIRVTSTRTTMISGIGVGRLEGHPDPVSTATLDRFACEGATIPISFDPDGQPLDVGREHRLFTRRQRIALAVRDGGCMDPSCDRPPSWAEAHHINHWHRDYGRTDTADGILLCGYHHRKYHNEGWEVRRHGGNSYWLIPPPTVDPDQIPVPMPSKSAAARDLKRQHERERERDSSESARQTGGLQSRYSEGKRGRLDHDAAATAR
jgi:hypothetical protein